MLHTKELFFLNPLFLILSIGANNRVVLLNLFQKNLFIEDSVGVRFFWGVSTNALQMTKYNKSLWR